MKRDFCFKTYNNEISKQVSKRNNGEEIKVNRRVEEIAFAIKNRYRVNGKKLERSDLEDLQNTEQGDENSMENKDKSHKITLNSIKIEKGLKIMSLYIDNGVYKFSDIFEDAYPKQGAELERFFNELKEAYISYYNLAEDNIAKQMDSDIRSITHDFFVNKFKMEKPQLTYTEVLGRKHLMAFLEDLILNFKSKNISSKSLMGLSKAYYFLDNYKKINYEGYLRLDTTEKGKNGNIHCYVLAIYINEVILSYEGYIQGPYGGDSEQEEMFNFDYEYDNDDEPEQKISRWKYNFNRTFKNTGTFSIDDSTEDIEEIEQDDDNDNDEQEEE